MARLDDVRVDTTAAMPLLPQPAFSSPLSHGTLRIRNASSSPQPGGSKNGNLCPEVRLRLRLKACFAIHTSLASLRSCDRKRKASGTVQLCPLDPAIPLRSSLPLVANFAGAAEFPM
eukprot:CAMPEP_0117686234 /NCGR_PEP_ID=MMETSP0804-20121206/22312_1 /TAXON_ID=1074897 /ORGANISM="Tetraselmis astigmatica, Strain CCMP880" /LENGTH=116 /DNA_ID=CAMNT_0005497855 /DNA_START=328 /DNA_END=677 /DNA_ORIENTATION=-